MNVLKQKLNQKSFSFEYVDVWHSAKSEHGHGYLWSYPITTLWLSMAWHDTNTTKCVKKD